ncbi:Vms1/Ankzf1 family peptidyl-tRNA hydrolase [Bogoriella caseilytica]|uniref:Peptide subunit release factor 1 (ERF1) n=1 Tax=Bogoriella caseilytica TaxID=56055 RepID=A0A3N2BFA1_9MICO|nr:Vms1/Ankzf1 family peptidyl-tRNA hydrolase [Bogoriella caseilytica]ROR73933.1 hypothetical protein EDD31_2328 [Bogoriella caseilytica]
MNLSTFTARLPQDVPLATVVMDASRDSETGAQTLTTRWKDLQRSLEGLDAPTLEALDEEIRTVSRSGGKHGRVIIAGQGQVYLDKVLADPPAGDEATLGQNPLALARALDDHVSYLLAAVDRSGADITVHGDPSSAPTAVDQESSVDGGHNELRKANSGALSHKRFESRAEDSWERNAEAVASELDRHVAEDRPELLILTGDVRARHLVADNLQQHARDILLHLDGGSRNAGAHEDAFEERLSAVLLQYRMRRRQEVLNRYDQARGQDGPAVAGTDAVLRALRRGQVSELILNETAAGPPSTLAERTVWVGDEPLQISPSREEVASLGAQAPHEERLDLALGQAAAAQGAEIILIDDAADGTRLTEGVGALLRWEDDSTPRDRAFGMSGDPARETAGN